MDQHIPPKGSRKAPIALNVLKDLTEGPSAQADQTRIVPTNSKDKFCHEEFLFRLLHPHLKF